MLIYQVVRLLQGNGEGERHDQPSRGQVSGGEQRSAQGDANTVRRCLQRERGMVEMRPARDIDAVHARS